jgi:hypothetical protein
MSAERIAGERRPNAQGIAIVALGDSTTAVDDWSGRSIATRSETGEPPC